MSCGGGGVTGEVGVGAGGWFTNGATCPMTDTGGTPVPLRLTWCGDPTPSSAITSSAGWAPSSRGANRNEMIHVLNPPALPLHVPVLTLYWSLFPDTETPCTWYQPSPRKTTSIAFEELPISTWPKSSAPGDTETAAGRAVPDSSVAICFPSGVRTTSSACFSPGSWGRNCTSSTQLCPGSTTPHWPFTWKSFAAGPSTAIRSGRKSLTPRFVSFTCSRASPIPTGRLLNSRDEGRRLTPANNHPAARTKPAATQPEEGRVRRNPFSSSSAIVAFNSNCRMVGQLLSSSDPLRFGFWAVYERDPAFNLNGLRRFLHRADSAVLHQISDPV